MPILWQPSILSETVHVKFRVVKVTTQCLQRYPVQFDFEEMTSVVAIVKQSKQVWVNNCLNRDIY